MTSVATYCDARKNARRIPCRIIPFTASRDEKFPFIFAAIKPEAISRNTAITYICNSTRGVNNANSFIISCSSMIYHQVSVRAVVCGGDDGSKRALSDSKRLQRQARVDRFNTFKASSARFYSIRSVQSRRLRAHRHRRFTCDQVG